jgi:RNA polymerase sigma factor for flagellar operon FliA
MKNQDRDKINQALWLEYKNNPTIELKQKIILNYTNLVYYVIHNIKLGKVPVLEEEDYFQIGIEGLHEAIERFDPEFGTKFETYAIQRIRGKIIDELRKLQDKIKTDEPSNNDENIYYTTLSLNQSIDEDDNAQLYEAIADTNVALPDEQANDNDLVDKLEQLISELDERDRLIISLYYYENLNFKQIAEVLNIGVPRVSQLHTKILNELKMRLSYMK